MKSGSEDPVDPAAMVRAAAEVLVYAPLGLGAKLVEDTPSAVDRLRQELSNARFIGRLTVNQGVARVRSKIDAESFVPTSPNERVEPTTPETATAAEPALEVDVAAVDDVPGGDGVPAADALALPDYDTLPAIDIVGKLETLSVGDRRAIERYELAHRQRRTVLGKLSQLAEQ